MTLESKSLDMELRIHDKTILLQRFKIGKKGSEVMAGAVMLPSLNSVLSLESRA